MEILLNSEKILSQPLQRDVINYNTAVGAYGQFDGLKTEVLTASAMPIISGLGYPSDKNRQYLIWCRIRNACSALR